MREARLTGMEDEIAGDTRIVVVDGREDANWTGWDTKESFSQAWPAGTLPVVGGPLRH